MLVLRSVFQFVVYALLATALGFFSVRPDYAYAPADAAVVKLSLHHATQRVAPCVRLTPAEVAALAPNMRRAEKCERARLALRVELEMNGELLLSAQATPSGLWNDGPASVYRRFSLPPGEYRLAARLRDSARVDGWDYIYNGTVRLQQGRYLTITFRTETGEFEIR